MRIPFAWLMIGGIVCAFATVASGPAMSEPSHRATAMKGGDAGTPKKAAKPKEPTIQETNKWLSEALPKFAPKSTHYGCDYSDRNHDYAIEVFEEKNPCQFSFKVSMEFEGRPWCHLYKTYSFRWRDLLPPSDAGSSSLLLVDARDELELIKVHERATGEKTGKDEGDYLSKTLSFEIETATARYRVVKAFRHAIDLCKIADPAPKEAF